MLDYICVLKAIRPHLQYHPAWKINFEGPNAFFIRLVGEFLFQPVTLEQRQNLQMQLMRFYYPDIRPLKPAVFRFAVKHNKPVIPITLSFRKRTGLWKLIGKNL